MDARRGMAGERLGFLVSVGIDLHTSISHSSCSSLLRQVSSSMKTVMVRISPIYQCHHLLARDLIALFSIRIHDILFIFNLRSRR